MNNALLATPCPRCSGTGRLATNGLGLFADDSWTDCPDCGGLGALPSHVCNCCGEALEASELRRLVHLASVTCDACKWDRRIRVAAPGAVRVVKALCRSVGPVLIEEASMLRPDAFERAYGPDGSDSLSAILVKAEVAS